MTPEPDLDWYGPASLLVRQLPEALEGGTRVGPYSWARPGALLRIVPGVGRFLARDGAALEYWVEPAADARAVAAVREGAILGALIHQRGELPLHATTLVSPRGSHAIALAGRSGAGKSTVAYEMIRCGWSLLSDDLTRVTLVDRVPTAWPGRPRLRLLVDACARFEIDIASLSKAPGWPGKYVIEAPRSGQPAVLRAVVVLERTDGTLRVGRLIGAQAARVLAEHTYRIHYVAALGQASRHLELVAATAARTTVLLAQGRAPVTQVAAAVVAALHGEGPAIVAL
jgi:hypothetical protein